MCVCVCKGERRKRDRERGRERERRDSYRYTVIHKLSMVLCEHVSDINESLKMLENFNDVVHVSQSNSYQGNRRIITRKHLLNLFFSRRKDRASR